MVWKERLLRTFRNACLDKILVKNASMEYKTNETFHDDIYYAYLCTQISFFFFQTLVFNSTNINSLQQINGLTSVRRLDSLVIELEGNQITKFNLWKYYILFRLAHFALKKINYVEVSLVV